MGQSVPSTVPNSNRGLLGTAEASVGLDLWGVRRGGSGDAPKTFLASAPGVLGPGHGRCRPLPLWHPGKLWGHRAVPEAPCGVRRG